MTFHGRRTLVAATLAIALLALVPTACTPEDIATIAINNHFDTAQQACAKKIVARESNYIADAVSPDGKNIGLFQINAVHTAWIKANYGYAFADLPNADKNAEVARGLSDAALSYYGDRWQPWRLDGKPRSDGSCAA
jgi:hypothetical protein